MPTYSYRCKACGHTFDKVQRITEDAIKLCPACGVEEAVRVITHGNFILKGGGWYSDLYSSGGNKKPEATKPEATKPEATKPASGESAPASSGSSDSSSGTASSPPSPPPSSTPSSSTPSSGS